ncbi:hypothetical protein QYE76_068882 [Lolium multiflorum]|uniref:Uncharacterized protein n=1 Tax=Lolium multiflorum TaxID=4521 RepID=A0AAD8WED6_LOLMU|nr:hypothetical protein QYE76_068882 [Lolium multiflorum]
MDPALKEYLDQIKQDTSDLKAAVMSSKDAVMATQAKLEQKLEAQSGQLTDLCSWKTDLEARFAKLHASVIDLERAHLSAPAAPGGSASTHLGAPSTSNDGEIHGPVGHGEHANPGGFLSMKSTSSADSPVKGMLSFQNPLSASSSDPNLASGQIMAGLGTTAPTMHFPSFNGENPNLWKTLAEQYFQMFSIHETYWVPMSTLHFTGAAGIWLQSVVKKLAGLDWLAFTSLLCTRFGRDRHQLLIRQFYTIKQITTVADYIERFDILMNHLVSYSDCTHPYYFLTRFVEGLRPDIRSIVMVQRPNDLDTACSLALLQEEVADGEIQYRPYNTDQRITRFPVRQFQHQQRTPLAKAAPGTEEQKTVEGNRKYNDDKIAALRNYRRAKGLCFKCGEKWGQEHTCPSTVQMHIVEELFALFSIDEVTGDMQSEPASEETETVCSISVQAFAGVSSGSARVIQLHAKMQGHEILVLVDSGSSTSFVNKQLATKLTGAVPMKNACRVHVADGSQHTCTSYIPQCAWFSQGQQFFTDLKILPLGTYDAILGMDWLEEHNPDIDWVAKTLQFQSVCGKFKLQGHCSDNIQCSAISATELQTICKKGSAAHLVHVYALDGQLMVEEIIPEQIQQVVDKFTDVFAEPESLPPRRNCDHSIPLMPGAQPVNTRAYRHKPELKSEIERQVAELLQSGVIQRSTSNFSSPAILVKKKDGTWRLCVDYRALNSMTVVSKYPVPIIDELLDELSGASWFSKLDLRAGYHQIRLAEGEEHKTAFQTHSGHWEYKVMPFGLAGAPATFLGAMNNTLQPLLRKCVVVFFDDILVYSTSLEDHVHHLTAVLNLLRRDHWQVKMSKCSFGQQQISYLGHVISATGVSSDPSKISKVASWPTPRSSKDVRSFLGLAGYYRKFVRHFGIFARPLFNLLKKNAPFVWTEETDTAFQLLKQGLIEAPVLSLPDFSKPFVIDTDACDTGVGAVLQQNGHPIAYMSKPLGPRHRGLSTYEKECLAILMAIEQWRPYLHNGEFLIRTDQKSLIHLEEQRLTTVWQQKAFTKLLGLRYRICYRKGEENRAADALSRRQHPESEEVSAISVCQPEWLQDVRASYASNPHATRWIQQLQQHPDPKGRFSLRDNLLYFHQRIWLGGATVMQESIMKAFHASKLGGHSGFPVTYRRIRQFFAWPKMKAQIKEFVQTCMICQQAKPERVKYPGLLEPLPTPDGAWKMVTMDFIEGLPPSGSTNCIMVVVDKFTRYAHFIPLRHPFTAATVAAAYMDNVFKLHSLPKVMVSDRDPIFTSQFWQEMFSRMGTELRMSSAYHPATDGQSERVNQVLEIYLRCFTHACPRKWSTWISLAEYWYNTSYHSALKTSPFVALYGHEPSHWGIETDLVCKNQTLQAWIDERKLMQQVLQQNLHHARQLMKQQADKNRTPRTFDVGDAVFVKLQPYVQVSVARRANHKLSFRYYGPYNIIKCINPVAYKVDLPSSSRIHPVFHVSQLRKCLKPGTPASTTLPIPPDHLVFPVRVIARRWHRSANGMREQVQVEWSDPMATDITWEDAVELQQRFPASTAWGQAVSQGAGDVSSPAATPGLQDTMGLASRNTRPKRMIQPNRKYLGKDWT